MLSFIIAFAVFMSTQLPADDEGRVAHIVPYEQEEVVNLPDFNPLEAEYITP